MCTRFGKNVYLSFLLNIELFGQPLHNYLYIKKFNISFEVVTAVSSVLSVGNNYSKANVISSIFFQNFGDVTIAPISRTARSVKIEWTELDSVNAKRNQKEVKN